MFKREIDWSTPKKLRPVTATTWNTKKLAPFLSDNTFGWISPAGEIHQVTQYRHLDFFKFYHLADKPKGIQELFDLESKDYDEAARRWEEDAGDEHPEWHRFEYHYAFEPGENVIARFTWIAYDSGWGRIGTYGGDKLELECADDHARPLRKQAKALAEIVGRELVLTPVAPYEDQADPRPVAQNAPAPS
ncbi:hypothetical protein OIU34_23245 [Pararhizobium sp. BT-229]|uniref:hypothetical protein n=1 Tax=Pararhizobium sp. BT-229 TaxID=2986923 RepID=UPI0021F80063|nr:hypothetical protein [Pararhizobium sp. BT-229]MCV9964812.1 hypothetical protein [Pararhizobium sp. BT-229]